MVLTIFVLFLGVPVDKPIKEPNQGEILKWIALILNLLTLKILKKYLVVCSLHFWCVK